MERLPLESEYELSIDDLLEVCEPLGEEHTEFLEDLEVDEALGYLYGALAETGIDPDEFLEAAGLVEPEETE